MNFQPPDPVERDRDDNPVFNAGIATITEGPSSRCVEFYNEEDWKLFQQLVNRAMNCWDRAPATVKEFGDMVTEGKIQQQYQDLGSEVKSA